MAAIDGGIWHWHCPSSMKAAWQCWWPYKGIWRNGWCFRGWQLFRCNNNDHNVDEAPKEYREIIQYLDGMRFPVGTTKALWTRIAHKSRNYLMISNQLYSKKEMVFYDKPLENMTPHVFCMISWWVLWRPLCGTNHNRKDFVSRLLLAHSLQGCPWLL
jgi:hypothetical protein